MHRKSRKIGVRCIIQRFPYVKDIADFYYEDLDADNLESQRGSYFAYVDYNNLTERVSSLRGIKGILEENSTPQK